MNETATPIRILLVEDDPDDYALMCELVEEIGDAQHYQLDWSVGIEDALDDLRKSAHDVYLVDFRLGAYTGLDLLHMAALDAACPPVIILTGVGNSDIDRQVMAAGAADYLVKDRLDAVSLERSLRYCLERTRLARRMAERERAYRLLFDANPMPMWVAEPGTQRIVAVNQAAIQHYGYSHAEFLAKRIPDLRPDETVWEAGAGEHSTSAGHVRTGHWRHLRQDGSIIDVAIARSDVLWGESSGQLMVIEDITAQLASSRRQRESEQALRKVLRDAADALFVIDSAGIVRYVNAAVPRLLGQPPEALVNFPAPPQLLAGNRDGVEIVDSQQHTHVVDIRAAESAWNGHTAMIVAVRDMTEARANERQLRLLRRAMEASSNGVLICDAIAPDTPVLYANPAFERITGYNAAEIIGHNCRFLQGAERDQPVLAVVRAAVASHSDCDVVLRNYRKDGTLFWNQLRISPVRDERGLVTHFVSTQTDVTAQRQAEADREWYSSHDALTGLPKYAGIEAQLKERLRRAAELGQRLAILFIDLDGFHVINDTMGYAIGDSALVAMARRLQQVLPDAQLSRFAGDEFVAVVACDAAPETPLRMAQHVVDAVADALPAAPDTELFLTASIGISVFPEMADQLETLLRQADLATNRAKRGGRSMVFQYTADLEEELGDRLALGRRMRGALERHEFLLHFQPQVSAHTGELHALEALVRWQCPELGLLPPRRFIPVAEDCGLIMQLGNWVLRKACAQLRQWLDEGLGELVMAVNVSASQMQRASFVDEVRQALEDYRLPPALLELELTESVLMENVERAEAQMRALKALGVSLSLDDFGMGYSSLGYLQRFPLDKLKIDQTFVAEIGRSQGSTAIVRAIIAMGHQLAMKVVAEGVEDATQFGYLRRNHCDELQGHLFCAALPGTEVGALLRKRFLAPELFRVQTSERTLLLLDDEDNILRALTRVLRRDGYRILTASTATEAFDLLARNDVQVIVSDQRMPAMSGTEFLSQVKQLYPRTIRMVLSGYTDLASVTEAINRGAIYKFLTKPWDDEQLRAHIVDAFQRFG